MLKNAILTLLCASVMSGAYAARELKVFVKDLKVTSATHGSEGQDSGGGTSTGGNGLPPAEGEDSTASLSLSTGNVDFRRVATNTTESLQVLVTSTGQSPLQFLELPGVTGDLQFYPGASTCGVSEALAINKYCIAEVIFSPTREGVVYGQLELSTNAKGGTRRISLKGEGYNPLSFYDTTLPVAKIGKQFSYDFGALLRVANEITPTKSAMAWTAKDLPAGLTMNSGVVSGTPSQRTGSSGTAGTISVLYKLNNAEKSYNFRVYDAFMDFSQVTVGAFTSCGLNQQSVLKCWGKNYHGQVGVATGGQDVFTPTTVLSNVNDVSVGYEHTCAVLNDNTARCWGNNANGRLGNNQTSGSFSYPVTPVGLPAVRQISAGGFHTCAVTTAGALYCWGTNDVGAVGDGTITNVAKPKLIISEGVQSVAAGYTATCAVMTSGQLKCWGSNNQGQLGLGVSTSRFLTPQDVMAGVAAVTISKSSYYACARTSNGAAYCWGQNSAGQLGNGATSNSLSPAQVVGLSGGVAQIATGNLHACAKMEAGGVRCWGDAAQFKLGTKSEADQLTPVNMLDSGDVSQVSAGNFHTCVLTNYGSIKCVGSNSTGQLGDSGPTSPARSALTEILE